MAFWRSLVSAYRASFMSRWSFLREVRVMHILTWDRAGRYTYCNTLKLNKDMYSCTLMIDVYIMIVFFSTEKTHIIYIFDSWKLIMKKWKEQSSNQHSYIRNTRQELNSCINQKKYILKKGILDPCSSFKMMNMSYPTSRDPSTAGREAFLTAYILENKIYN